MSSLINKFRSIIPPNSKIKQLARTVYHRFNMIRFSFVIRDWIAKRSCKRWLKLEKNILPPIDNFSYQPKVSFIISLIGAPQADFLQTYQSINKLIGNQWELLCIVSEKETREISFSIILSLVIWIMAYPHKTARNLFRINIGFFHFPSLCQS